MSKNRRYHEPYLNVAGMPLKIPAYFSPQVKSKKMLSLVFKPKKTTLVFPTTELLWTFFELAEVSEFRLESSKHVFIGKLQPDDIELAKKRFGANVV
jgi:hypothetical protein